MLNELVPELPEEFQYQYRVVISADAEGVFDALFHIPHVFEYAEGDEDVEVYDLYVATNIESILDAIDGVLEYEVIREP